MPENNVSSDTAPMTLTGRLSALFFAPAELMKNLKLYPKMAPLIIMFVIIGAAMAGPSQRLSALSYEEMQTLGFDYSGLLEGFFGTAAEDFTAELETALTAGSVISGAISGIITPFVSSFFSAIGLIIIMFFFKIEIKFTHIYSMFLHISVVTGLVGVVSAMLSVANNTTANLLSLGGILIREPSLADPVFTALSAVSVAAIWQGALVMLGLKHIFNADKVKAAAVPAVYILCSAVIAAGSSAVIRSASELIKEYAQ